MKNLRRGDAVWFISRVTCCIEAAVAIELLFFAGDPGQHPGLNAAEVGTNERVPRRYTDHAPAAVAQDRQRALVQLFDVLIIAGRHCSDRSVEILDDWPLQVLRLESLTGTAAGGCSVVTKRAADTIIITSTGEQGIDLSSCCLGASKSKLQHPLRLYR